MSFTWTLLRAGWADCYVEDSSGKAKAHISYITRAPEEFLEAVTRLVLGAAEQRVQFEAEPNAFRWIFNQHQDHVDIRLFEVPDDTLPDTAGTTLWTSRQPTSTLARAVIRAFDQVEEEHGEDGYLERWRSPFPGHELDALRAAWRSTQAAPELKINGPND
jgi:hypothetical protein